MTIKPKKNMILYIFCICFAFILINSTIVLTFSNNYREVFGQGYIPPPSNSIQSKSFLCSQVGYSGPTYTGPDGCATPCPTTGENIPKGCPTPSNNSKPKSFLCSQVGYSGPTYTGPDGCATPCPTTGENIPKGCPVNPIDKGEDIHIGNQSGQTQTNTPSGSGCPPGVQSIVACNFGQTHGHSENNSSCNTAACAAGGGSVGNDRFCDLLPCTSTTPQTTTSTTSCLTKPQNITSALQAAICGLSNTQPGSCPPGVQSIVAC